MSKVASYTDEKKPLPLLPEGIYPARLERYRKTDQHGDQLKSKFGQPIVLAIQKVIVTGEEYTISTRLSPRIGYDSKGCKLFENFLEVVTGLPIDQAKESDDDTFVGARYKIHLAGKQNEDGVCYADTLGFLPLSAPTTTAANSNGSATSSSSSNGNGKRTPKVKPAAAPAPDYEPGADEEEGAFQ